MLLLSLYIHSYHPFALCFTSTKIMTNNMNASTIKEKADGGDTIPSSSRPSSSTVPTAGSTNPSSSSGTVFTSGTVPSAGGSAPTLATIASSDPKVTSTDGDIAPGKDHKDGKVVTPTKKTTSLSSDSSAQDGNGDADSFILVDAGTDGSVKEGSAIKLTTPKRPKKTPASDKSNAGHGLRTDDWVDSVSSKADWSMNESVTDTSDLEKDNGVEVRLLLEFK